MGVLCAIAGALAIVASRSSEEPVERRIRLLSKDPVLLGLPSWKRVDYQELHDFSDNITIRAVFETRESQEEVGRGLMRRYGRSYRAVPTGTPLSYFSLWVRRDGQASVR